MPPRLLPTLAHCFPRPQAQFLSPGSEPRACLTAPAVSGPQEGTHSRLSVTCLQAFSLAQNPGSHSGFRETNPAPPLEQGLLGNCSC